MSETYSEAMPVPLSTELLDTRRCLEFYPQLNDFENDVFGPDFACPHEQIKPWADSGCLFYAVVCGEAVAGRRTILSETSLLITSSRSRDRLLTGQIADYELAPWTAGPASDQPTIYFSSVVSDAPQHLAAMYDSLFRDVDQFRKTRGLNFHSGFGIASGLGGRRHLDRNGFRLLQDERYRGRYDILYIDATTAVTAFWRGLLDSETV